MSWPSRSIEGCRRSALRQPGEKALSSPFKKGETAMWNIVIGGVFIVGGLSGQLALRGTQSSSALVVVGIGLVIWGVVQLAKKR